MNKLVGIILLLAVAGCTSPCDLIKIGVGPIAELAASPEVMKCENVAALETCIARDIDKLKLCKPKAETPIEANGLIGDLVCPRVADGLKKALLNQYCPEAKCTGGDLVGEARDKFILACKGTINI